MTRGRPRVLKHMPIDLPYDLRFEPPAPVIRVRVGAPGSDRWEEVDALIDSGADVCVIPSLLIGRLGLRRVDTVMAHGIGEPQRVSLYSIVLGLPTGFPESLERVVEWANSFALLGRTALNLRRIVLDGPAQMTSIE